MDVRMCWPICVLIVFLSAFSKSEDLIEENPYLDHESFAGDISQSSDCDDESCIAFNTETSSPSSDISEDEFPLRKVFFFQDVRGRSLFLHLYRNYYRFIDDIFNLLENNDKKTNVSEQCSIETKQLRKLVKDGDKAAKKFIDATGRPQSNTFGGGVSYLGSFSECIHTEIKNGPFIGQYCLAKLNIINKKDFPRDIIGISAIDSAKPAIGICIPSSCKTDDAFAAINGSLRDLAERIIVSVACQTKEAKPINIYATCMIYLFFLLVIVSCGDIIVECTQRQSQTPEVVENILLKDLQTEREQSEEIAPHLETLDPAECEPFSAEPTEDETEVERTRDSEDLASDPVAELNQSLRKIPTHSCWKSLLIAFSAKKNLLEVFDMSSKGGSIECLDGIRLIGMLIILFSHTFFFATVNVFFRNPEDVNAVKGTFLYFVMSWSTLAVDLFYFISGFVICYATYKKIEREKIEIKNFPFFWMKFFIRRYFRLTPVMMAIIVFCATFLHHVSSGPNYLEAIAMYNSWCQGNWWRNLLHIQNLGYTENMCLGQSWYISTDMQFSLFAPLIVLALYKAPYVGVISAVLTAIGSMVTTGVIMKRRDYPAVPYYVASDVPPELMNMYYKEVYMMPHTRIAPYLIGMLMGYFILKKPAVNIEKIYQVVIWSTAVVAILLVLGDMFHVTKYNISTTHAAAFGSIYRPVFALGLGILILGCHYKFLGLGTLNSLLSWKYIKPWSRLSYVAYLIHPVIMDGYYGSLETDISYSTGVLIFLFLAFLTITYVLSPIFVIFVEVPFRNLADRLVDLKKETK